MSFGTPYTPGEDTPHFWYDYFSPRLPTMSLLDHPERAAVYRTPSLSDAPSWRARVALGFRTVTHHISKHVGVGIICAVAYFDP